MKIIKNLFFVAVLASAVLLSACGGNTNNPDENKAELLVKYDGKEITKDTTITFSKITEGFDEYELIFDFEIVNQSEQDRDYTITEDRGTLDMSKYEMRICIGQCVPGDKEKVQVHEVGTLVPSESASVQSHFVVSKEMQSTPITAPIKYTISDGVKNFTITVNFDYKPQN